MVSDKLVRRYLTSLYDKYWRRDARRALVDRLKAEEQALENDLWQEQVHLPPEEWAQPTALIPAKEPVQDKAYAELLVQQVAKYEHAFRCVGVKRQSLYALRDAGFDALKLKGQVSDQQYRILTQDYIQPMIQNLKRDVDWINSRFPPLGEGEETVLAARRDQREEEDASRFEAVQRIRNERDRADPERVKDGQESVKGRS